MGNEKNQVQCSDARREGDRSTWHAQGTSVFTGFYTVGMRGGNSFTQEDKEVTEFYLDAEEG